jgi:hypothetical protein
MFLLYAQTAKEDIQAFSSRGARVLIVQKDMITVASSSSAWAKVTRKLDLFMDTGYLALMERPANVTVFLVLSFVSFLETFTN